MGSSNNFQSAYLNWINKFHLFLVELPREGTLFEFKQMDERYIGFILAMVSNFCIGVSFVITRYGLLHSSGHGN